MDECKHGMDVAQCSFCSGPADHGGQHGSGAAWPGTTKQDIVNDICDQLAIPRATLGVGSSIPSEVFDEIRMRCGLAQGSMPEIGEACASAAGLPWSAEFDSRGTISGGGSTVTLQGLQQVSKALAQLL